MATLLNIYPLAMSMESLLIDIEKNILGSQLSGITDIAVSLAAVCTAISLIGVGSHYLKGEQFDRWKFVRPLLIFFIVWNFSSVVLSPIRGIAGVYNTKLASVTGSSIDEFKEIYKVKAKEMCHENFGVDDSDLLKENDSDGWLMKKLKGIGNKVITGFFGLNEKINYGASTIVSGVLFFFINMYTSVMVIIAHMFLIIMALIGPFTFAISILTAYPNGIKMWIERYIQYTLWQPLLYMVMYIGTEIMVQGNQAVSWGGFWTWIFMCVAIFTMIKQVPGIASFVIESAGTEALANQMSGIGGQVLQKASSAAMIIR